MDYISGHDSANLRSLCEHCGNITLQEVIAVQIAVDRKSTYSFTRCTICDGMLLRRHPGDWTGPIPRGEKPLGKDIPFEQLWPPTLTLPAEAPDRVRKIYHEACLIRRHSASSFVVQIRRALEAVANDKKAEGKTLQAKTEALIKIGMLPQVFGEMSHISRMIGNLGAHDAEKDVTDEEVEVVDQFFRAIIEYLYVASNKISKIKALLGKA